MCPETAPPLRDSRRALFRGCVAEKSAVAPSSSPGTTCSARAAQPLRERSELSG